MGLEGSGILQLSLAGKKLELPSRTPLDLFVLILSHWTNIDQFGTMWTHFGWSLVPLGRKMNLDIQAELGSGLEGSGISELGLAQARIKL